MPAVYDDLPEGFTLDKPETSLMDEAGGVLARAGRATVGGLAGMAGIVSDPMQIVTNKAVELATGEKPAYVPFRTAALKGYDVVTGDAGLPRNQLERVVQAGGEGLAGGAAFGGIPKLAMQSATDMVSQIGAGAAAQWAAENYDNPLAPIVMSVIGAMAPQVAQSVAKGAVPTIAKSFGVNPEKVRQLEQAGISLNVPAVSDSPMIKRAANQMAELPGGKALKKSMDDAFGAAEKSIKSFGYTGKTTPTTAGETVSKAFTRWKADSLAKFKSVDDALQAAVPDDAPVSVFGKMAAPTDDAFKASIKREIDYFDNMSIPAARYGISQDMIDAPLADVVSSLDIVRAGSIKPKSILSEIRKIGGIKPDDLGELKATGLTNKNLVGVVNNKGQSLDYVREALTERGLLPQGSGVNDLLDLLDDQARGIVGASDNKNYELASRFLDEVGIDVPSAIQKYRSAGDEVVQGLRAERDFLKRQFIEDDYAVNPKQQNTLSNAISSIVTEKGLTPRQIAERANHPAIREMQSLVDDAARNNGQLTLGALKEARTKIGNLPAPNPLMPSKKDALTDRAYGQLTNLMEDAYEQVGGKEARAAFTKRNILYKNYADEQTAYLGKLQKKLGDSPEAIFNTLTTGERIGATKAGKILAKLNPDELETVRDAMIFQKGGADNFNIGTWANSYEKMSQEAKSALFGGDKAALKAHDDLIQAVNNYKDVGKFANFSGTTPSSINPIVRLTAGGGAGGAVLGLLTGAISIPTLISSAAISAGSAFAINKALSGMMASPKYTKLLSKALTDTAANPQKYEKALIRAFADYGVSKDDLQAIQEAPLNDGFDELPEGFTIDTPDVQLPATIPDTQPQASLLNRIMMAESSGRPMAMNDKSTAAGLFQFTDGTWNNMVKKYGDAYGITKADKMNPQAQQTMASLLLQENGNLLTRSLGRQLDDGDYYVAHVLGAPDAARVLKAHDKGKSIAAASLVGKGVPSANRGIFYDGNRPRSVREVVAILKNKVKTA